MKSWYSVSLGDGIMAAGQSAEIEARFTQAFAAAGNPAEMAVFTRYESEGRLQCEVMVFFSPTAAGVAQAFDARPCNKPARAGLTLLAGDERAWSALFPEGN